MGSCGSGVQPEQSDATRALEKLMAEARAANAETKKLLFLGTGGSGKSTFMKQIIQTYGKGFSVEEKLWWKRKACTNVFESLTILSEEGIAMRESDEKLPEDDDQFYKDLEDVKRIHETGLKTGGDGGSLFTKEEAAIIERQWNHALVQHAYHNRGEFSFDFGDIEYFFSNAKLGQLSDPAFVLSHDDITYVRSKTNGVYEMTVTIKGIQMIFIDVAGQRSSRKKWIGCFSDVTAVIWVSALDNYNEVLFEDDSVNAMDDALECFEWAVNNPLLEKPVFALFLNKIDILERKLKQEKNQLEHTFDDYDGKSQEDAEEYFKELFLSCVPEDREVPAYAVQGTDSENANKVLDSVIFGLLEGQMADMFG